MKLLYEARSSKQKLTIFPYNKRDFHRTVFILPLEMSLFFFYLLYTEIPSIWSFSMCYPFLWNMFFYSTIVILYLWYFVILYLWTHNYFRCIFHKGAFIFWFSLYLFVYLSNFPPSTYFYCLVTWSILLTLLPLINLFAPTQFWNWIAKF